jgi:hypothetical protein
MTLGPDYEPAREIFERVATEPEFMEFPTLPAYERLVAAEPAEQVSD